MFDPIIVVSSLLKLAFAAAAIFLVMWLLRRFDARLGIAWRVDVWPVIKSSPAALAGYFGARFVGVCVLIAHVVGALLVAAVLVGRPAEAEARGVVIPSTYDREIKAASARWLPGLPPALWKAQLYQESRLRPDARSPVGAEGLAQFMPATWAEVSRALGYAGVPRQAAGPAIDAGAYYMSQQRRSWSAVADLDRHRLAAGNYNAGGGNIRRAVRACDAMNAPGWSAAVECLPGVTGRHAAETIGYVAAIWRWWALLEGGGG